MDSITKKCGKCGQEKKLYEFTKDAKRSKGRHSICKACKSEYDEKYRRENAARIAKYHNQYFKNNKEKIKHNWQTWYENNKNKVKASNQKWIFENPEKHSDYQKKWRTENAESLKEYYRKYREEHREELNKKHLPATHKRRSRIANNGGSFSAQEWLLICDYYGNKCLRCGATDKKLTVDHVIPTVFGGTSNIDNLQPLCQSCNSSKHAKEIDYRFDKGEFAKRIKYG